VGFRPVAFCLYTQKRTSGIKSRLQFETVKSKFSRRPRLLLTMVSSYNVHCKLYDRFTANVYTLHCIHRLHCMYPCMWQWHCTTFCIFAFDVTDSMFYSCVTVLLHVLLLLFTFLLFALFIIFYFLLFYGLMPEIKMHWIGLDWNVCGVFSVMQPTDIGLPRRNPPHDAFTT